MAIKIFIKFKEFYKLIKKAEYTKYSDAIKIQMYNKIDNLFEGIILETGCGESIYHDTKFKQCKYIGIDLNLPTLYRNKLIDFKICADVSYIPLKDASVNLIVCRDLVEHLLKPELFFKESGRCLKKGGALILNTPNLYGGVALLAKFVPQFLSNLIWKFWKGNDMPDYPFIYKANTSKAICRLASNNGLIVESIFYINDIPHWFRIQRIPVIATILYALGEFYHKIGADFLLSQMVVILRKQKI